MEITGNIKIYKDTEQLEPLYTLKTVFYLGWNYFLGVKVKVYQSQDQALNGLTEVCL